MFLLKLVACPSLGKLKKWYFVKILTVIGGVRELMILVGLINGAVIADGRLSVSICHPSS